MWQYVVGEKMSCLCTLFYRPLYATNFGGATAVKPGQMEAANGFSNSFFGWGGEDNDFFNR